MSESTCAASPTPLWRGWYRPNRGSAWVVVAEGTDEQQTHDAMLASAQASGDFFLAEAGKNPNQEQWL